MKRILILSIGGKTNEPEDLTTLHLYFLSLKKNVVPFFDVKVILYNCALESIKTKELVELYELSDVVAVRRIDEMELSERALEFMEKITYWESRIGLIMNMMFDYSSNNNFFNSEWVFQTDTDIEFLPNFAETLESIDGLKKINDRIVISQAGDVYEHSISVSDRLGYFKLPRRVNLYDQDDVLETNWMEYILTEHNGDNVRGNSSNSISFNTHQQKIRNDFIGMSKAAALQTKFNWIHACSNIPIHDAKGFVDSEWSLENPTAQISINADKGSLVAYELFSAKYYLTHIQLQGYNVMSNHINAGWCGTHYNARAVSSLSENYSEFKHIWLQDFTEAYMNYNEVKLFDNTASPNFVLADGTEVALTQEGIDLLESNKSKAHIDAFMVQLRRQME